MRLGYALSLSLISIALFLSRFFSLSLYLSIYLLPPSPSRPCSPPPSDHPSLGRPPPLALSRTHTPAVAEDVDGAAVVAGDGHTEEPRRRLKRLNTHRALIRTHPRTHPRTPARTARTPARTFARPPARTHARTHARTQSFPHTRTRTFRRLPKGARHGRQDWGRASLPPSLCTRCGA